MAPKKPGGPNDSKGPVGSKSPTKTPTPAPAPAPVASGQAMSAYDSQYNSATTDAQKQAIVAARDETNAGIAAANDAWHKARGTGPYAGMSGTTPTTAAIGSYTPPSGAFSASAILDNLIFTATGISGLGGWALGLSNLGASAKEIVQSLRYGTDASEAGQRAYASYLSAYPKMNEFISQGIFAGESPELQYQSYRNTVKEAAARYNINSTLVANDKIADYISGRSSAAEIVNRMSIAASAVATTPPDTLSVLRDYYGVQNGDLISFYLDPSATEAQLQQRYTAAQIGSEAIRQDYGNIGVGTAEGLAAQGVTMPVAAAGFATANRQKGFMSGAGEIATGDEVVQGVFGQADAKNKIERIAGSRAGAFTGGGQYLSDKSGAIGLGTTTR